MMDDDGWIETLELIGVRYRLRIEKLRNVLKEVRYNPSLSCDAREQIAGEALREDEACSENVFLPEEYKKRLDKLSKQRGC